MTIGDAGLFTRAAHNPIITAASVPYPANSAFNAGAARVGDETVLLVRVEDMLGISVLHVAAAPTAWTAGRSTRSRCWPPRPSRGDRGCEDPRLTWLPDRKAWAIAYTAYSRRGPLVSLATTRDFRSVRRLGPAMPPEDKDAALFPRQFDGRWLMVHRPTPLRGGAHMWLSYSPDLRHWGEHTMLLEARDGAWWDAGKIGLGPPPLETEHGWLVMYHGVHLTAGGPIYRVGFALLDREDPSRLLRRSDEWVLGPRAPYERDGDVAQVVFPCGWVADEATDSLLLYYGAADTTVSVASASLSRVLDYVLACPTPDRRRAGAASRRRQAESEQGAADHCRRMTRSRSTVASQASVDSAPWFSLRPSDSRPSRQPPVDGSATTRPRSLRPMNQAYARSASAR